MHWINHTQILIKYNPQGISEDHFARFSDSQALAQFQKGYKCSVSVILRNNKWWKRQSPCPCKHSSLLWLLIGELKIFISIIIKMGFTKYLLSNLIFLLSRFPDIFQIDKASFLPDGFNILQSIRSLNICLKSKGGLRAVCTLGQFSPAVYLTKVRFCVLVELLGLRHILRTVWMGSLPNTGVKWDVVTFAWILPPSAFIANFSSGELSTISHPGY